MLLDLPTELLSRLCEDLPPRDLSSLGQTCTVLHAITRQDHLWRRFALQRYSIPGLQGTGYTTFYELFTKILYHHGYLLGLWYTFDEEETRRHAKPEYVKGFVIRAAVEQREVVGKKLSPRSPLPSGHIWRVEVSEVEERTVFRLPKDGHSILRLSDREISYSAVRMRKYTKEPRVNHPLEGLYAALYGGHGMEFISVSYVSPNDGIPDDFPNFDDPPRPHFPGPFLRGTKLCGDPNIPAARTSLLVDLLAPVAVPAVSVLASLKETSSFTAYLQIAMHGYVNPQFTNAVFVMTKHDQNSFHLYWPDVSVVTRYTRI